MPLYEFRCRGCSHEFETLVRAGSNPSCPSCGGGDLERLISTSFSVKGAPGLSPAARRAVQKQQKQLHRDQDAYQTENEKKHLDD
jgi:putative FmdB family regulatory protein